ncbi:hypothetical protein B0T16DRAFT_308911, partial [Cercophora newfieldiana]
VNASKALSSLKGFFPPIHQPLPLSTYESQKLLNTLTTSFRTRLDEEHGIADTLPKRPVVSYLPSTDPAPSPVAAARSRPTDRHLGSILNNPLFKQDGARTPASPAMEPNEVFEAAVAKGLMTIPRAHGFLKTVRSRIQQSSAASVSKGMSESGAGRLVVQWLRASGQERELSFLNNRLFTGELLWFMVAEGFEGLVLEWYHKLISQSQQGIDAEYQLVLSRDLLALLTQANGKVMGQASAFDTVCLGELELRKWDRRPLNLLPAWVVASRATTQHTGGIHNLAPATSFERFVDLGWLFTYKFGNGAYPPAMDRAHIDLYHPTKPSPTLALEFLDVVWNAKVYNWRRDAAVDRLFLKRFNWLAADTAQHLLRVGKKDQSQELL